MGMYKYLSPNRIDVIRNAQIRFTQPDALNDPFELKPFFKTIFKEGTFKQRILKNFDLRPALAQKYDEIAAGSSLPMPREQFVDLALTYIDANREVYDAMLDTFLDQAAATMPAVSEQLRSFMHEKLGNAIGILSLSEDPTSDLMWAHYAANHLGFLIEFDEKCQFFHGQRSDKDEFFRLRKVKYVNHRLIYDSFEQMADDGEEIFVSKSESWSYEKEWRMLVPLVDRQPEISGGESIHLIPFPRSAIKGVILGHKSTAKLKDEICLALEDESYGSVRLKIARIDLENGKIVINNLER